MECIEDNEWWNFKERERGRIMRMIKRASVAVLMVLFLMGCANMTPTQQSTLSGGAMGAAAGAGISAISGGSAAVGAAVGGAAGALGGYISGQSRYGY
jgi:hypothetical protein